jgi:predicted transcriptional regulator
MSTTRIYLGYMVKLPCQEVVWDLLPAIRAALAASLVRKGRSQQEAARLLEMAPAAISQYLSGKRGYRIEFDDEIRAEIDRAADELASGNTTDVSARLCTICRSIRERAATGGESLIRGGCEGASPPSDADPGDG